MPEPVVLEFKTRGLTALRNQAKRAAEATRELDDAATRARNSTGALGGGSSSPRSIPAKPMRYISGPNQRLGQLYKQHFAATSAGNSAAVADIERAIARTERQVNPRKTSAQDRLTRLVASTRIGSGGEIMPLVGQLAAATGPYGLVAAGALVAGKALYSLSAEAAQTVNRFTEFQYATGSTGAGSARLAGLGGAAGLSLDQTASLSASLSERLRSDPMAQLFGGKVGLGPALARPFDQVDEGERLVTAIEGLRRIVDRSERIRTARALGLESALPIANLSEGQYQFNKRNSETLTAMQNATTQAADFAAASDALSKQVDVAKSNFAGAFTPIVNYFADFLKYSNQGGGAGVNLGMAGPGGFTGGGRTSSTESHKDGMAANTEALKANTEAVTALKGAYGTPGTRYQGAIPAGLNSEYLRNALSNGAPLIFSPF